MAVDRGENAVTHVPDLRRRIALCAYGALRLMDGVQKGTADIEDAIRRGQYDIAAFQARNVVLICLSVRSLAVEGEIELDDESVSFDFFAGLPADDVAAAITLANGALDVDEHTATDWLAGFQAYVTETERLLGYDAPLPVLRSPDGAFGLLALSRRWIPLLDEVGVPSELLSAYIDPTAG